MFSRKEKISAVAFVDPPKNVVPSIISRDLNILGNLVSDGYVEIVGKVEGNVICNSATIHEHGVIKGDIVAEQVQINGEVRGLIKARHVRVSETGKVTGVVMYETLSIKDGAFIDGQCKNTDVAIRDREKATQRLAEDHALDRKKLPDELKLVEGLHNQE